ncbi:MAG: lamin tail domain-containing protein [Chitinophagales bacterium]
MKKLLLSLSLLLPVLCNAQLLINEVAYSNRGYHLDNYSETSDWVELYNAGPSSVNIAGYGLTDDTSQWNKWQLPDLNIASGGRKIVYLSTRNLGCYTCGGPTTYLHTNFKLKLGEPIALYDNSGNLLDIISTDYLRAEHTLARIPDGGDWCYSSNPTANAINTGTCYTGYAETPDLNTAPGFYTGSVDVYVSGTEVHYTTDGDWPDEASPLYSDAVHLTDTKVFRAVGTAAGKLPSKPVTGTYFVDETTALPVVSISSNSCDMFDEGVSCPGAYDNVSGWFQNNPQINATVEYFTADHQQQFSKDVKFEIAGNSSIALYNQRSMQFEADEDFNGFSEFDYNVFEQDKPSIDTLKSFRVRAMLDWGNSNGRMKDLIYNRMALPTDAFAAGFQNVATFINGDYWGHYCAREELDADYLRNNWACNPDSVVIIRSGAGDVTWETCEVGQMSEYTALYNFIHYNDMAITANYEMAKDMVDIENWVDWMATQVFIDNNEMPYNVRFFKSHEPEIKWHFMLWDTGAGGQCETCNSHTLMYANYGGQTKEVTMFDDLLDNPEFKSYYINRYADLMNYYYTWPQMEALIDADVDEMESEMPAQYARWGFPSPTSFTNAVNELKGFFDNRIYYQRNDVENHFGLNDQVDITIDVNPPGAGYIKISTIIPEDLPWTGVYFDGNPVQFTAIANPGFTFTNWDDNAFIADVNAISFTNNISDNTTFVANFTGSDIGNAIVISEINYNSSPDLDAGDWIELHNFTDVAVDVTNYTLRGKYFYGSYKIPSGTIIPAHGYLVIAQDTALFATQHPDVPNVYGNYFPGWDNGGDSICLVDFHGNIVSSFSFGDALPWPETADGYGRTMELKFDLADPSLPASWIAGCVGGSPGMPFMSCFENPVIDEINYNSSVTDDAGDWFEMYNYGTDDIHLGGWTIQDKTGNVFTIPLGTTIVAGGYFVFYQDYDKFNAIHPGVINSTGPFEFGLNNDGDVISIYTNTGELYQTVSYDDVDPYPLSPDGGGTALQIINAALNLNDPSNWTESCPLGTPGTEYAFPCANAVEDPETHAGLQVYPNPTDGIITIVIPNILNGNTQYTLYDLTGSTISVGKTSNNFFVIDMSDLPAGIYHIQCINGKDTYSKEIIRY